MAIGDYVKSEFVNGGAPGISAERLNNNEDKNDEIDKYLLAQTIRLLAGVRFSG